MNKSDANLIIYKIEQQHRITSEQSKWEVLELDYQN